MANQTTLEWLLLPCGKQKQKKTTFLLAGMTFNVFDTSDGAYYPLISHLLLSVPIALFLALFRKYFVERYELFLKTYC